MVATSSPLNGIGMVNLKTLSLSNQSNEKGAYVLLTMSMSRLSISLEEKSAYKETRNVSHLGGKGCNHTKNFLLVSLSDVYQKRNILVQTPHPAAMR
jgi:hypothetical protein